MKVKFVPQDVEYEIAPGQTLMDLGHKNNIPIRSTCNGMPSCAECRVRIIEGDSNVNPPSRKELNLIGTGYYIDQRRLSCQVQCFGDIVVDTAEQLDKTSEGPITKKFLSRVHKTSAQDTHSLGGVLIEQDEALLKQIDSANTNPSSAPSAAAGLRDVTSDRPQGQRHDGGGGRNRNHRRGGRNRHRDRR